MDSIFHCTWQTACRKSAAIALAGSVSLLVLLLIFALHFYRSASAGIKDAAQALGADIVLVPGDALRQAEGFLLAGEKTSFYLDSEVLPAISKLPAIKAATWQVYLEPQDSGCCSFVAAQVIAFDPATDFIIAPWLQGSPPPLGEGDVYVGSTVSEYLGMVDTPILFNREVRVTGQLRKTGTGLDNTIFLRGADLDRIAEGASGSYRSGRISIIFLKLKEGADLDEVTAQIRAMRPALGTMTRKSITAERRAGLRKAMINFAIAIALTSALTGLLAWFTFAGRAGKDDHMATRGR